MWNKMKGKLHPLLKSCVKQLFTEWNTLYCYYLFLFFLLVCFFYEGGGGVVLYTKDLRKKETICNRSERNIGNTSMITWCLLAISGCKNSVPTWDCIIVHLIQGKHSCTHRLPDTDKLVVPVLCFDDPNQFGTFPSWVIKCMHQRVHLFEAE